MTYFSASVAEDRRPRVLQPFMIQRNQYVCKVFSFPLTRKPSGVIFAANCLLAAHCRITISMVDDAKARFPTYVLKVEEDGVESKEHEANSSSEPVKSRIAESVHVNPDTHACPALWLSGELRWVRVGKKQGDECHQCDHSREPADSIAERAAVLEEETNQNGIDDTSCQRY